MNRQRIDKNSDFAQVAATKVSPSFRPVNRTPSTQPSPTTFTQIPSRGRLLVLTSSQGILSALLFFYKRAPASLISWNIGQQAFNSSMILLLDALETGDFTHVWKVEQAYVIFRELQDNGVHQLAGLAVDKLSWGLDRLRQNMEGFGTHQPPVTTESERAAQDEASRVTGALHDTVMGNTGMLLLEEVELQSYTPERFAPFTWAIQRSGSEATITSRLEQDQKSQVHDEAYQLTCTKLESSNKIPPISNELQSNAGSSQRSAMRRHFAPSLQETHQPQSCATTPASPMSLAPLVPQQDRNDGTIVTRHRRSQQEQSPHPEHVGSCGTTPPSTLGNGRRLEHETDGNNSIQCPQRWVQPALTPKEYQGSAAQLRHNSCPSLQQLATTPPILQPTYPSPLTSKAYTPMGNEPYDMHTHWSANPAAPMLDSLTSGMMLSPLSAQGHVTPAFRNESAQEQQKIYQYSLPRHTTSASANAVAATNVEQMTVDQWKRWVESGGAG